MTIVKAVFCLALLGAGCTHVGPRASGSMSKRDVDTEVEINRTEVLPKLRASVKMFLLKVEREIGHPVRFLKLPGVSHYGGLFQFDFRQETMRVSLAEDWSEHIVAHELLHGKLSMGEGYCRLNRREGIRNSEQLVKAASQIISSVDHEAMYPRLRNLGFVMDGDVYPSGVFDTFYPRTIRTLEQGTPRSNDGMSVLDSVGYGALYRASRLIKAELMLKNWKQEMTPQHIERTKEFIASFRKNRKSEAAHADQVLASFGRNDVHTVKGHSQILIDWTRIAKLDRLIGLSCYERQGDKFHLPAAE